MEVKTDNNDIGNFMFFFLLFFRDRFFKKKRSFWIENLFDNSCQNTDVLDGDQDIWVSSLF